MGKKIDLTGHRFGRLVVVEDTHERYRGKVIWKCLCDCGNVKNIKSQSLRNGSTRSCGCLEKENRNRINEKFIDEKVWEHENTLSFHERDRAEKGTKITTIRPDRIQSNNKSGVRGVMWDKSRSKWRAEIKFKGEKKYLGSFHNKQDAINARKEAEEKYFQPILEKYGK